MFWGLIMEPNKRYTQTVEKAFHVSMACLEVSSVYDDMVQVMLCYDGSNYLLCSLTKDTAWQVPLDLNFEQGTKIAFICNGNGHVHLTGYLIPDEDIDLQELEEEDIDELPEVIKKQSKRKTSISPNEARKAKRIKQEKAQFSEEDDESFSEKDSEDLDEDDDFALIEDDYHNTDGEDEDEDKEENNQGEPIINAHENVSEKISINSQRHEKKNKHNDDQGKTKQQKQNLMNGKEVKQANEEQGKHKKKNKKDQQELQNVQQESKKRIIGGGVEVEDIKIGNGNPAKSGKFVSVYYVGRLKNGKKFDATTQGDGFKFRLGKGEVIKGWDIGISGMKTGGKRRITIPPALGYGAKGSPPVIPGNSTLIFEVELRKVH